MTFASLDAAAGMNISIAINKEITGVTSFLSLMILFPPRKIKY
jgi:hypothetical protein